MNRGNQIRQSGAINLLKNPPIRHYFYKNPNPTLRSLSLILCSFFTFHMLVKSHLKAYSYPLSDVIGKNTFTICEYI